MAGKVKYDNEIKKMCKQDELSAVLSSLGCSTKAADLDAMLKEADLDADGKINYEEMVQWLCRAPHLEQYFLLSLDIFKRNFKDVDAEVLNVQKEMQRMQKEYDEGGEEQDEEAAMKRCLSVCQKMVNALDAVQKTTQKRVDDELTPVIKMSFKYHDKDNSGALTYDEGIIFFSNIVSLWEPFGELMSEMNCAQEAMMERMDSEAEEENLEKTKHLAQEKVKLVTPDKLHAAFKQKYAVLKGERQKKMDEHHKAAFEVLAKDGKVTEDAVVEALLHGHEKNGEFLAAMGLRVEEIMKAAEPMLKEMQKSVDNIKEAMGEMDQMMQQMQQTRLEVPVIPVVGETDDPGDCQVQ